MPTPRASRASSRRSGSETCAAISPAGSAWQAAGLPIASTLALDPQRLAERLRAGDVTLVDVREEDEWRAGHVEGSLHVPYRELRQAVPDELAQDGRPLAVRATASTTSRTAASMTSRTWESCVWRVSPSARAARRRTP